MIWTFCVDKYLLTSLVYSAFVDNPPSSVLRHAFNAPNAPNALTPNVPNGDVREVWKVTGWWWRCRVSAPGHQDHNICQETVLGWFTFYTLQPRKAAIISDILHTHPYRTTIWKSRNLDADQFYGHDFVINPEFWLNFGPAPRLRGGAAEACIIIILGRKLHTIYPAPVNIHPAPSGRGVSGLLFPMATIICYMSQ